MTSSNRIDDKHHVNANRYRDEVEHRFVFEVREAEVLCFRDIAKYHPDDSEGNEVISRKLEAGIWQVKIIQNVTLTSGLYIGLENVSYQATQAERREYIINPTRLIVGTLEHDNYREKRGVTIVAPSDRYRYYSLNVTQTLFNFGDLISDSNRYGALAFNLHGNVVKIELPYVQDRLTEEEYEELQFECNAHYGDENDDDL